MSETPPQFAAYPRQTDPRGYYGPPDFRIEAISEAYRLLKADWTTWIVSTLITIVVVVAISMVGQVYGFFRMMQANDPRVANGLDVLLFAAAFSLIAAGVSSVFYGGIYRVALQRIRLRYEGVAGIFRLEGKGGRLFLWGFLQALPMQLLGLWFSFQMPQDPQRVDPTAMMGAFGLFFGIMILVGLLIFPFFLTPLFIVDQDSSLVEAAGKSWRTVTQKFFRALGVYIATAFVSVIGIFACGIGILFTAPLFFLTLAVIYRDHFIPPLTEAELDGATYGGPSAPYDISAR